MEAFSDYRYLPTGPSYTAENFFTSHATFSSESAQKSSAIVPSCAREWDAQRDVISRLYHDMNLPLKEVQRIMEVDYNFKATSGTTQFLLHSTYIYISLTGLLVPI